MNTTRTPSQAKVLRTLSRVFRSQAISLDRVDSVRAKQAQAEQVQLVRGFRM